MFKSFFFIAIVLITLSDMKHVLAFEKAPGDPYIPPGFERPWFYRFQNFYDSRLPGLLASIFSPLFGSKYNSDYFYALLNPKTYDSSVSENDTTINGVDVRIYKLKSSPNENNNNRSIMVYFHGGSYLLGDLNAWDKYLRGIVKSLDIIIIAVNYRLAPNNPYPIPVYDCYNVTKYVINNAEKFGADANKFILAGDSAGGNAVLVTALKLAKEKNKLPKLIVPTYPWVQMIDLRLPSQEFYGNPYTDVIEQLLYFGVTNITQELLTAFYNYNHLMLIKDANLRNKYISYLNASKIAYEYRKDRSWYANNGNPILNQSNYEIPLDSNNIFVRDKKLAEVALKFFDLDASPLLADDQDLASLPETYMTTLGWDYIRDEYLIFAERLKSVGVNLKLNYYDKAFHGIVMQVDNYKIARQMQSDLIEFLKSRKF